MVLELQLLQLLEHGSATKRLFLPHKSVRPKLALAATLALVLVAVVVVLHLAVIEDVEPAPEDRQVLDERKAQRLAPEVEVGSGMGLWLGSESGLRFELDCSEEWDGEGDGDEDGEGSGERDGE